MPLGVRSRPLVHRLDLGQGDAARLERQDRGTRVVPVRFVQACTRGHVSDIDWRVFVHGKGDDVHTRAVARRARHERRPDRHHRSLRVRAVQGALGGDEAWQDVPLGYCNGPRPWLGPNARERCGGRRQAKRSPTGCSSGRRRTRTSRRRSRRSRFPSQACTLRTAVDEVWADFLQVVRRSRADVRARAPEVKLALRSRASPTRRSGRRSSAGRAGGRPGGEGHPRGGARDAAVSRRTRSATTSRTGWFFARTVTDLRRRAGAHAGIDQQASSRCTGCAR